MMIGKDDSIITRLPTRDDVDEKSRSRVDVEEISVVMLPMIDMRERMIFAA